MGGGARVVKGLSGISFCRRSGELLGPPAPFVRLTTDSARGHLLTRVRALRAKQVVHKSVFFSPDLPFFSSSSPPRSISVCPVTADYELYVMNTNAT